jgi:hypothetical protein
MNGNWSASPLVVFMATMVGVGVALIVITVWRNGLKTKLPKRVADWLPALEQHNMAVVYATANLAEKVRDLVNLRAEMPPECQRIADQVLAYTQVVEEQLFEELAKNGVVPRYMFGGPVSDVRSRYAEAYDPGTADPPAIVIDAEAEPIVIQLPSFGPREWVGRQLLRRPS